MSAEPVGSTSKRIARVVADGTPGRAHLLDAVVAIAELLAYARGLERRIAELEACQQAQHPSLDGRLNALEAASARSACEQTKNAIAELRRRAARRQASGHPLIDITRPR